jgi:O-methyltransferase domain
VTWALTLCGLLVKYPHLRGTALELPSVIAKPELLWADKMGVGDRCTYVPGDMFREVPPADAYMVKRILHGWSDSECVQILSTMHRAAPQHGRVWIMEGVVPGPDTPLFQAVRHPQDHHVNRPGKDPGGICWTAGRGWVDVPADVVSCVQDAGGGGGCEGIAIRSTGQRRGWGDLAVRGQAFTGLT